MNTSRTITTAQSRKLKRAIDLGLQSLKKPEPQTLAQWADQNFYLSPESSYAQGPWTSEPFQVAILNMIGNDDIIEFNWIKSARVGYTKIILCSIAYFAEHKQRNQMLWQPTDGAAEEFTKQHVDPMIRDVKPMRALAPWADTKHRDNTISYKRFSNSRQLHLKGGKAAKNYREKSVDVAYYDELSSFEPDVEKEGNPLALGDKRIEGSAHPKSVRGSTPKLKDTCLISLAASEADVFLRRYVPCPRCKEMFVLKWGGPDAEFGIKWDKDENGQHLPATAFMFASIAPGLSKTMSSRTWTPVASGEVIQACGRLTA